MGLDTYHRKAVMERPNATNPSMWGGITEESFEGFNVEFGHFSSYIQSIDCSKIIQTVIIVEEERYLQETISWFGKKDYFRDYLILFKVNVDALQNDLDHLENQKGLRTLYKHINTQVAGNKWKILEYCEIVKKTGFYSKEVGYQRKGMNEKFWIRFYSDIIYDFALWEDFEYAYECVDYYWTSDTKRDLIERKKKFKEDFLDKYEFGASFLSLSY